MTLQNLRSNKGYIYLIFSTCLELKTPNLKNKDRLSETDTKIDNFDCKPSYGKYGTRLEADFACKSDSNCKYVLSKECVFPNDYGHYELCGYNSNLSFSTPSCLYKKLDTNRSGKF